jgi:bifunctional DNA-binding transcriptional regulator/antitoxin component of YhaV-PrlF toxin-antitoxin module
MRPIGIVKMQGYGSPNNFRTTIPKDVVLKLGLVLSDKIIFCENDDGDVIIRRIKRRRIKRT